LDLGQTALRWQHLYLSGNLTDGTNSLTVANAKTAYDHSQDNTQAHTDYLLNSGADVFGGTLTPLTTNAFDIGSTGALVANFVGTSIKGSSKTIAINNVADLTAADTVSGLWTYNGILGDVGSGGTRWSLTMAPTSFNIVGSSNTQRFYGILDMAMDSANRDGGLNTFCRGINLALVGSDTSMTGSARTHTFGDRPDLFGQWIALTTREQDGSIGIGVLVDADNYGTECASSQVGCGARITGVNSLTDPQTGLNAARFEAINASSTGWAKGFSGYGQITTASATGTAIGVAGVAAGVSTARAIGLYGTATGTTASNYGLYVADSSIAYLSGSLQHAGSTAGFFNITPVARAGAFTQTYSTATHTHSAFTAATLTDSSGGTASGTLAAITGGGSACENATKDAVASLASQVNKLIVDLANAKQVLNGVIDDLQAYGLLQ